RSPRPTLFPYTTLFRSLLISAGPADETSKLLGQLRLAIAKRDNLVAADSYELLWVTEFPLLEFHEEDGRWYAMHHPFTSPLDERSEEHTSELQSRRDLV